MSGICGIVNLDGAPIDRAALGRMTAFMAFRGPDAQHIWTESRGNVGFGHTLLATTFESKGEQQPASLDGKVWITADARIDGQAELKKKLASRGRVLAGTVTDAELILHAYAAWDEDCVKHLLGDFAFAIWDAPRRRLFCARDHFGVKPFFYALLGKSLIFSNTLQCVRVHPAVSGRLDDLSIADFLLFEWDQDPAGTVFCDISRLPPSHLFALTEEGLQRRRYWDLPDREVSLRPDGDYVEHFTELLETAVADRLRSDGIGIEMSGGLDSTAIAAIAKTVLGRHSGPSSVNAFTLVHDSADGQEEGRHAKLTADMLDIPIDFYYTDRGRLYEQYDRASARFPEPLHDPNGAASIAALTAQASRSRIVLTGWDGDALMSESPKPYFRRLLKERRFARLASGVVRYAISERKLMPGGLVNRLFNRPVKQDSQGPAYPGWLNSHLEDRYGLRARWEQFYAASPATHPLRPNAFRALGCLTEWSNFFDGYDPGVTGLPLESRHPLLDLRLVDYCLTLPPMPWCVKKQVLRSAMRGRLPEAVRLRPKTPVSSPPLRRMLRAADAQWIDRFVAVPALGDYVDRSRIPNLWGDDYPSHARMDLRPLSLNLWLQKLHASPQPKTGKNHDPSRQTRDQASQEAVS